MKLISSEVKEHYILFNQAFPNFKKKSWIILLCPIPRDDT